METSLEQLRAEFAKPVGSDVASRLSESPQRSRESSGLGIGATALVVAALLTLVVFRLRPLPITGDGSIGQYSAITSAVVATAAFIAGRFAVRARRSTHRVLEVMEVAAMSFAHGGIALVSWWLLAEVIASGFVGAPVFGLPSMLIAGTMAGLSAYVSFTSATHMRVQLLAAVLPLFLIEGVFASMLTASDPRWWRKNLSALGETDDASALAFNLTLVVGGLIVTTLARYATRDIRTTHVGGLVRVRLSVLLIGISLALVGLFPADAFYWVHTVSATAMAVVFGVLIAFLPRWIPGMPRLFTALGWLFIVILVVQFILFATGYYTLTAVELVVGTVVIAWIILFVRSTASMRKSSPRQAKSPPGAMSLNRE